MHSLAITRDTRRRHREKISCQTHLFNIGTIEAMDLIAGQVQVKLSLLRSVSLTERTTGPAAIGVPRSAIKI
jgi:hypothetical protein